MKKVFKTMAFTLLGLVLSVNLMAATAGDAFSKITSVSDLADGDEIIFVNQDETYACGTTQSTNNRTPVSISISNSKYTYASKDNVQVFEVKKNTSGQFGFHTGSGYIYSASSSKNYLKTNTDAATKDPAGTAAWTLSISSGEVTATNVSNTSYYLAFNGTDYFSQYKSGQSKPYIYKKQGSTPTPPTDPSLSVDPTTINFGEVEKNATVEGKEVTVTIANITEGVIAYFEKSENSPFEIDNEELTESGTITITPKDATLAEVGEYSDILTITDADELEKTVAVSIKVKEPAAPTGTFEKFTGATLKEGDYVICVATDAMKNSVTSNRLDYASVTVSSDKITNPEASVIWHIAPVSEDVWSIFNAAYDSNKGGFAAGTGTKNQAGILPATTDVSTETKAQWTCAKVTNGYNFENVANNAAGVNSKLQKNGTYGFACYGSFSDITLYKKYVELAHSAVTFATCENGSVGATVKSAAITSGALVEEDEVVTLTNTPAEGYKLDVYSVTETGGEKTVTVTDGKFTMPAFPVTISATFSLSIETPELSVAGGDKDDAIKVKVSNYKGEYSYYYTLDGTNPTNASTLYVDADGIDINASCTLKVIAYKDEVTSSVVSAAYNLPLMTMDAIFAKATAVGSTATAVRVKFTNCVVTGVSGDNVYLTDNAGKGLIIYQSSHGFAVNDKLNGVVNVQLLLYRGSSEIKGLTSSTDGLTVTKDGSVSPITTMSIASLSGVNTGAVLSYTNLIYDNGYFSDGENTIQPYNTFKIADYPDFADGDKYNVTGVYIQYNTTKEIAPRSLDDLEKIEAQKYAINLANVEHGTIATDPEEEAADGIPVTLTADPENGYMLEAYDVYKTDEPATKVTVANGKFTMPAYDVTVSATFVELPIWATTYTSNVTIGTDKVKLAEAYQPDDYPEDGYEAKKDGTSSKAASIAVKVPAKTTGLHYHLFAWNGEGGKTVTIKKGGETLATFKDVADASISGNSPYTLQNNPADAYGYVALEGITEETTITFSTASGNQRIVLFGVNAVQPAAISIDPTSKDFGEVKANSASKPFEFTIDPNDFVEGTPEIEIIGEDAAWFSYTAITGNAFTVTFSPEDEKEVCSATLNIKLGNEVMCSASLTGKAISATTPEILVPAEPVDFGTVLQGQSFEPQEVYVTLNNLIGVATIDVTGNFEVTPATLNESGNVIVSVKSTETAGSYEGKLTISSDGATSKEVSLKAQVADKWAYTFTSNVKMSKYGDGEVSEASVVIDEKEYEGGAKAGTSSKTGVIAVTLPEGAHTLHFHAVGWNNKTVKIMLSSTGEATISAVGPYTLVGEATGNSPFTLSTADNCALNEYYTITLSGEVKEGDKILFSKVVDGSDDNRFVLYGVNQEGGVLPVLDHITIEGEATKLKYNTTDVFDPVGLTVSAVYTLKGVEQTPVPVTEDVNWTFDPATFNEVGEGLSVTATASFTDGEVTKTADKVINGISVEEATPSISASKVNIEFGEVIQDATVEPIQSKITLKYIDEVSVTLSETTAFEIDKTSMTETGYLTISAVTSAEVGEYTATVTIKDLNSETSKDLNLSITIKEAPKPVSYTLVTDASTLKAGDVIVMAATYSNKTYVNGALSDDLLTCEEATLTDDVLSAAGACEFTLAGGEGAWTLTSTEGILGATNVKKLTYDNTKANFVDTWTISISNNVATIAPDAEGYGRFMYNHNNSNNRFLNYTSAVSATMLLPQLYVKAETYKREGVKDNYGTICLPYTPVDEVTGADFYEVLWFNEAEMDLVLQKIDGQPEAGTPYIFQYTDSKMVWNYDKNETPVVISETGVNGLHGVAAEDGYTVSAEDEAAGVYLLYNNKITKAAVESHADQYRAYIKLNEVNTEAPAPSSAPRIHLTVPGNGAPTNFNGLNGNMKAQKVMKNGQLYIIRDTKMYNAQGQLVK